MTLERWIGTMADYRTTLQKIYDCRDKHNIGVTEAKRIVERDELRQDIMRAEDLEDIRRVLLQMAPKLEHGDDY